jgi:hypothetical protein
MSAATSMRTRRIALWVAAAIAFVAGLLLWNSHSGTSRKAGIEKTLSSNLAVGDSAARVVAFLDSSRIRHSGLVHVPHHIISADFGELRRFLVMSTRLNARFYFDDKGKLTGWRVEEHATGP